MKLLIKLAIVNENVSTDTNIYNENKNVNSVNDDDNNANNIVNSVKNPASSRKIMKITVFFFSQIVQVLHQTKSFISLFSLFSTLLLMKLHNDLTLITANMDSGGNVVICIDITCF